LYPIAQFVARTRREQTRGITTRQQAADRDRAQATAAEAGVEARRVAL
jgi:hypothetical protein